jgi:undecaprenyl-diphosphatase
MQALDFALFGWLNADASAPLWLIDFARFASEVLPALLAVTIIAAAMFDKRWRYALFTALVSVLLTWLVVNAFRSALPFPRPAAYGLGIQWAPQGARPGFPSLHTATTFAAAFSLWCLPRARPCWRRSRWRRWWAGAASTWGCTSPRTWPRPCSSGRWCRSWSSAA